MKEKQESILEVVPTGPKDWVDAIGIKEKGSLCDILSMIDTKFIESIIKPENFLGEWCSKQVYRIPNLPDFVLYIIKKEFKPWQLILPFEQVNDFIEDLNCWQTVAVSPSWVWIMKRVHGSSHGIDVWINKMKKFDSWEPLEIADAIKFYNQIKAVASSPIEAYIHFAKQLKILNQEKIRIDSINPNNVMIDSINNTFCIIDFEDINTRHNFSTLPDPLNGAYDMRTLLSDWILNLERLRILPEELKDSFIKYTIIILEKCKIAASSVNLNTNYDCTIEFFKKIQSYHSHRIMPLDQFCNFMNYYWILA